MSRARDLGSSINSTVAGKNFVINGNFDFWQRGTSFTYAGSGAAVYTADRFSFTQAPTAANYTITRETNVPNGNSVYSYKCTANAAHASTVEYATRHWVEGSTAAMLIGKSATVSFWYRSNRVGTHGARLGGGILTGGTDQPLGFQVFSADTWEYKTITYNTATYTATAIQYGPTGVGLFLDIGFRVGGTQAGLSSVASGDYFQITQIQLEIGSVPTPFSRAGGAIAGEFAKCQRYYQRKVPNTAYARYGSGQTVSTTNTYPIVNLNVPLRVAPTVLEYSSIGVWDGTNVLTATLLSIGESTSTAITCNTTVSSGLTVNRPVDLLANNNLNSYIAFGAEL